MSEDSLRWVNLSRVGKASYTLSNQRGGELTLGEGTGTDFTPVELLLGAIAGCSAIDVDYLTGKRAEPMSFRLHAEADKVRDADGNHLTNVKVTFDLRFPEGEDGDRARAAIPRAIEQSRDRLCTVSRTVQLGTPVTMLQVD